MRKEYNDRWNAPLVNPGFTIDDSGAMRPIESNRPKPLELKVKSDSKPPPVFQPTIDGQAAEVS